MRLLGGKNVITGRRKSKFAKILRIAERIGGIMELVKHEDKLYSEIKKLIDGSRNRVASVVNSEITDLYWKVGSYINEDILNNERAAYGKQIIKFLSEKLTLEYGRGWSEKQLRHCVHLAMTFPYDEKFSALRSELNWTCIKALMYIEEPLKRDFY